MNKVIILISLFIVNVLTAQIHYGIIEYNAYFGEDELFRNLGKEAYEEFAREVEAEEFVLEFNKNASVFYSKPSMSNSNNTWYYKEKDSTFCLYPNYTNEYLISEQRTTNWEITSESKEIQGFTCYKAVSSFEVDRGVNFKKLTFPLIVWFTPEIPFGAGPFAYDNLPGVALEIQIRNITYGAKSINLKKKEPKTTKIEPPLYEKYQLISLLDYNEMIVKQMGG